MALNVLTIAASDPSGGAGIEADVKVACAFRVNALTAITALTAQDTSGVKGVVPTDPGHFNRTLGLLADDQPIAAIKIGAMATSRNLESIRDFLLGLDPRPPAVLDPVFKSTGGFILCPPNAAEMVVRELLLLVALITPNAVEAAALTGIEVKNRDDAERAARKLVDSGARAALVKGGHLEGRIVDVLCWGDKTRTWEGERAPGEYHGTGCALSMAIACGLARGMEIPEAVGEARGFLLGCMKRASRGKGEAYILDFLP